MQDPEVDPETMQTINTMLYELNPGNVDIASILKVTANYQLHNRMWGPTKMVDLYLFHLARLALLNME